jgi:5-methylcytosine-specific restriction endonuclease McrA
VTPAPWTKGDTKRRPTRSAPSDVRVMVDEKQRGRFCVACAENGTPHLVDDLVLDHLLPLSKGGDNHWSNLRWMCRRHNLQKGNRPRTKA